MFTLRQLQDRFQTQDDCLAYGMDATPTLVLVDRRGIVTLYHPGQMTRAELEPYIKALIG